MKTKNFPQKRTIRKFRAVARLEKRSLTDLENDKIADARNIKTKKYRAAV